MGKGAQAEGQALALAATEPLAASEPSNAADDKETRFMTALLKPIFHHNPSAGLWLRDDHSL